MKGAKHKAATHHTLTQRTPLRTRPNGIAGILDVGASDDGTSGIGGEEGTADAEGGIGAWCSESEWVGN